MARRTPLDESPPEVWQEIISYLPKADMHNCRLISHAFSDLSTPVLFSCVTITFGTYDPAKGWGLDISVLDKGEGRAMAQATQFELAGLYLRG
ncbi:uncharacterized protein B0H18DRAFT_1015808 [Fomitopsis serialis]|uniref:uncharacterized protein n=1 Tax=Fomitopsis serialis TaxID=139415 RepID=UPI002007A1A2|nr:uncharacterized protein B0H18DRAFT_1015808 [Neoantrodia serialis]KAH9923046.1 hypothetical protein B0H18DRAFT_1015808 [Neoantrodia serialis]